MEYVILALILIVTTILVWTLISHLVYHRSLMASIVCLYFRLTVRHYKEERIENDLKFLPSKNDVEYHLPKGFRFNKNSREGLFEQMKVFHLNPDEEKFALIYLHGGGYVRQPRRHHLMFLKKLAKYNKNVIVPIYPKGPNHHPDEVYALLTKFYLNTLEKYQNVILMGDSSGGGLALGLTEYFKEKGYSLPKCLILMSPWCDLTLENPLLDKYQKVEPLINYKEERVWAKCWAKDMDLKNYMVSPMFGNLNGLPKIFLFVGERELLYPDTIKLNQLLKESDVDVNLIIGKGMNHVYQIYPIPEARKALKQINLIIKNEKSDKGN